MHPHHRVITEKNIAPTSSCDDRREYYATSGDDRREYWPIKQDGTDNRLMTEENIAPHHRVMTEKNTCHSIWPVCVLWWLVCGPHWFVCPVCALWLCVCGESEHAKQARQDGTRSSRAEAYSHAATIKRILRMLLKCDNPRQGGVASRTAASRTSRTAAQP